MLSQSQEPQDWRSSAHYFFSLKEKKKSFIILSFIIAPYNDALANKWTAYRIECALQSKCYTVEAYVCKYTVWCSHNEIT